MTGSYDTKDNILSASDGTTTHQYTYGDSNWHDKLMKFDGESITYDASGNPTSYYNGTRWSFTWGNGRSLTAASGGGKTISFTYDLQDGTRSTKTVGTEVHNYIYAGGKLLRETYGNTTLDFIYDVNGRPYAMIVNETTTYYYITNLQGDVINVVNSSGTTVASYEYDPYGNPVVENETALGFTNPLRYRGYYYDAETGLYLCGSRYYDSVTGRFINADTLASTGQGIIGNNMFVYCLNNPVNHIDSSGTFALSAFLGAVLGGALGGAAISAVSYVVGTALNGQELTANGLLNAAGVGAICGALGGAIGTIFVGAGAASATATVLVKGLASLGVGLAVGLATGIQTEGPVLKRVATGAYTGMISAAATFGGSLIDASNFGFAGNMFANFAATLFVGAPAEMLTVTSQQNIAASFSLPPATGSQSFSHCNNSANRLFAFSIYQ